MQTCSSLYAPVRLLLRDKTWGHEVLHPSPQPDGKLQLICGACLQTWAVEPSFQPSPIFVHRQWLAKAKGIGNVLRPAAWRKAA